MSAALLKKSLKIVEETLPSSSKTIKRNKNSKSKYKKSQVNEHSSNDFRARWRMQDTQSQRPLRPSIEEIRKRKKDESKMIEEKIALLLKLRSQPLDDEFAEMFIQRARTGRYVIPEQKPKEEEKSIFTEEDFEAFEKEYLGS